jgi:hypothetical protein
MTFLEALKRVGWSKSRLAKELGYTAKTVSTWGDHPPLVICRFLEERIQLLDLKDRIRGELGG